MSLAQDVRLPIRKWGLKEMRTKTKINPRSWLAVMVTFGIGACAPLVATAVQHEKREASGNFTFVDNENGLKEVTLSGNHLSSQDELERRLLYKAASLTKQNGFSWFVLRHMPGEGGADAHPPRPAHSFGAIYGHWQSHFKRKSKLLTYYSARQV